ncbi:hypothetical protein [Tissierella sp.]|uniref:hypothetical protein n=1 Tax=Tissierella sp. TaxID=41274 RepID=UPI0030676136
MNIETNFDNLEYDKANNIVYDKSTGEIIDDKLVIEKAITEQEKQERKDKAKKRELNRTLGKVDKRETHDLNWKSGKKVQFIKIYRTEKREYIKTIRLSPEGGLFLFCIDNYIEMETNRIAKPDGSNFTNKELQELTGLGRDKLKNVLNELEEKLFIIREGQRQAREIYYNPYLSCAGNELLLSTKKMFDDAGYKPITQY